ncbi:MAG TPA: outer membrane protein transport protein [Thermoanaerobaculia bacterium]|nr:outer membrane protein transport protein [Thermoanaerobaculia bacterium]
MGNRRVVLLCFAGLLGADLASAAGFGLFQHGGRGMGQAGAFTARASEPSAVTYNPAAITRLEGFQLQAGLDFSNAEDTYESSTGRFSAAHVIQFPPSVYLTWKPEGRAFALGLGLDSPFWYRIDWEARLFPGRYLRRITELEVFELHPVLAYDLGGGWSVGGGARYVFGSLEQADNGFVQVFRPGGSVTVEVERDAKADVDDIGWDAALHYAAPAWGWGVVYRSPVRLKGSGEASYTSRDAPDLPGLDEQLDERLRDGRASQAFELPRELRTGIWFAPYPELRLELDADYEAWSSLEETAITYNPDTFGDGPTILTRRDWKDTTSLRLGLEGDLTDTVMMYGGVAYEPSPVPSSTVEPGFPRGDAMVYAAGMSYSFPQISFDLGYSFHEYNSRGAEGQELLNPAAGGRYTASEQVWGFAVRWRY